jgi:regulator of cell morphogenesis and NO signaling
MMTNIIIRFLPPVQCEDTCEQLLVNLFRMESDLEDHTRIEENVLIPNVKKLERKVMEIYGVTR